MIKVTVSGICIQNRNNTKKIMELHKNIPLIGSYYFLFLCAILGLQISTQIASIFKSTKQVDSKPSVIQ